MRSSFTLATVLAAAVSMWSCGGGGGSSSSPTTPGTTASTTTSTVTVNIVTSAGNQAYSPNPVQAATGSMIVWKNNTLDGHHIVMDDGSAVIGDIAPGGSSAPLQVKGSGGNFHCTNHPSMVGSINGATAPTPAPGSGDGY